MVKRILSFCFLLLFLMVDAQDNTVFCKQVSALQEMIKRSHFRPKPVNDSLSKGVFDLFIDQLDDNKSIFLQSDIDQFKVDAYQLDDYLLENSCGFIDKYISILKERIDQSKSIVESLRSETLDYSGKDTLYFTPSKKRTYFKDSKKLGDYWSKRIRYLIISKLIEEDSLIDNVKSNFEKREAVLKPKIIDNQLCLLDEALKKNSDFDAHVKETFLNALLNYEDPNSTFFNNSDKTIFEGGVSSSQLSFGIQTSKTNNGDIVIAYIAPGSPAFKNEMLEENDVIKSVSSDKEILETYCVSNEDIMAFLNNENHQTLTFKTKKVDGTLQDIQLTKALTKVEENSVRGFVVSNELDFGYLKISSFYTDLETTNGLSLANDVAKELYKLNQEHIKGLIIDLRFNGGGSMKEAADLSGMFIDRGPLSVIKYQNGETYTIHDTNRGTLFTKPIVVLINSYSASASEFFASAMQDYNRAVIVGSPSHGKSSAQVILPLSDTEDLGFCKITVEKFYRITGLSHQSTGVIPDVALPSLYDSLMTNERFEKFALPNDSITVSLKYQPFKKIPTLPISSNSTKRTENNIGFLAIKKMNATMLNDYIDKILKYPLTLDNVYKDVNGYNTLWSDFYTKLDQQPTNITVRNTNSTEEILQYNSEDRSINQIIKHDISKDIYVEEASSILLDLITSKNPTIND